MDLRKRGLFYQYAARNAISWYQFVNGPELDRRPENGSLYLVTGCDKSPAWGVASYSHPLGGTKVSLKFMAVGRRDDTSLEYSWENYSSAVSRTGRQHDQCGSSEVGPESSEPGPNPTFNQCVFVRGLRISLQQGLMRRLLGERVKVEEGVYPLYKAKGGITSTLPGSTAYSSSQPLIHNGSPHYARQHSDRKVNAGHDILLENISDVSDVSFHFSRCLKLTNPTSLTIH